MSRHHTVGVTGATGQVGSHLIRHLRAGGVHVVAAVRNPLSAALCDAAVPGCEIRVGSLIAEPGRPHLLDDCDIIINCALESSGGIPQQAYTRNQALADGLLEAKSLRWLIHFSTVAVYGELIDEHATAPRPTSEYGRSKLHVEKYIARRARTRRIQTTIVRLGHVYGAGIARSREMIELARNCDFRLPFGGRRPSNAIHADAVGAAVLELVTSGACPGVCSLAEHSASWRQVFDWHTRCLSLPPVPDMSEEVSNARRAAMANSSVPSETIAWLKQLPIKSLMRSPAMFDLALRTLVKTPEQIVRRVAQINRRSGARAQIAKWTAAVEERGAVPQLYFSFGMPGPFLHVPQTPATGLGSESERARALREWFDRWRAPRMRAAVLASPQDAGQPVWR